MTSAHKFLEANDINYSIEDLLAHYCGYMMETGAGVIKKKKERIQKKGNKEKKIQYISLDTSLTLKYNCKKSKLSHYLYDMDSILFPTIILLLFILVFNILILDA